MVYYGTENTEYIIFHILEESLLKLQGNVKYNRQM